MLYVAILASANDYKSHLQDVTTIELAINVNYTVFQKKEAIKLLAITFSNLKRFSKFIHC